MASYPILDRVVVGGNSSFWGPTYSGASSSGASSSGDSLSKIVESTADKSSAKTTTDTFNRDMMPQEALTKLLDVISGRAADPLLGKKDMAAAGNIDSLVALLGELDLAAAEDRASGRVADLTRQLREQVLPQIFGGAEMAGTGGSALAQLLAQDAAIRTGEAQSRAIEEARNTAINQTLQQANVLREATAGTSATSQQLMEALGIAKGAVERGTNVSTQAGTEKGTSKETTYDPLAWARLQAELSLAQKDKSGQALAAFMAAGGDPAHLSGSGGQDFGLTQYTQDLMKNIQRYL